MLSVVLCGRRPVRVAMDVVVVIAREVTVAVGMGMVVEDVVGAGGTLAGVPIRRVHGATGIFVFGVLVHTMSLKHIRKTNHH